MKISTEQKVYALALSFLEGIGPIRARKLIEYFGGPKSVWEASNADLQAVSGITKDLIKQFQMSSFLEKAQNELAWAEHKGIQVHYYSEPAFPWRMKQADDSPIILFQKGNTDLNVQRTLAIVGTRSNTNYGRDFLHSFVPELHSYQPLLLSGLAYGIDALAHRNAVKQKMPNVAVLAHGFDRIYPASNRRLAEDIISIGGSWISEFPSGTKPDRENFPKRNRLIAACADAVVVVEAANKGGALITADLANSYNRDVFSVPGRHNDAMSSGCNRLIKSQQAHLLESVKDLAYIMGWEQKEKQEKPEQLQIFPRLTGPEQKVLDALRAAGNAQSLDGLHLKLEIPSSSILGLLLSLELKSIVETIPGPLYRLKA